MQKIFWIGNSYFHEALTQLGWQVHFFDFKQLTVFTWEDLVRMANFEPDVVVVADKSLPPFLLGMENFPCFTIFYAIDTHIHSWYPYYAQAFDACLVSLKDHIPLFQKKRLPSTHVRWTPAFAKDSDSARPDITPHWDCLFVGTINQETTPKRKIFLDQLQKNMGRIHCTQGKYAELFPQGRVILNYCELGDLNFRVFEALACGSCLVTPQVGHGFNELFTHAKDLYCYDFENVDDAHKKILYLLEREEVRKELQEQGLDTVNQGHRATHRAQSLSDFLESVSPEQRQKCIDQRRNNAQTIRSFWLKPFLLLLAEAMPHEPLRKAYLQAALGNFGPRI